MAENHQLWGGRFTAEPSKYVQAFGASIDFDQKMAAEDLIGSLAHVAMLKKTGILKADEADQITTGLHQLQTKLAAGELHFSIENEDIHLNLEKLLTDLIGPVAGKLHTARSRNDQVAVDMHLYLKKHLNKILPLIKQLQETVVKKAADNVETLMPGYTHMQHAQPISYAHYLLAYFEMFRRDYDRFEFNLKHTDMSPLGAAALAGTTFPTDRDYTAEQLGFGAVYQNSLDAVSDRDFILEFLSNCAQLMMHLSRFCEEIVLWDSQEFHYLEMDDTYSTGSSIMPQKKNPDMAELIRGKTGRVYGDLMGLLTVMKGLPLAYNKDFQEDKEGMFDAVTTVEQSLTVFNGMLGTLKVQKEQMAYATTHDFANATELADYLASKGLPFRQAHELVGELVLKCLKEHKYLKDVSLADYQAISPLIQEDIYLALDPKTAVERRNSLGGTGFKQIKRQIAAAKALLKMD
ncbi:argininosuccinate lyase [Loigolactobacillus backii]|uniref:Argininosuccinate lyase n=1 Tax=Loigolactobacillus backii TaxID=375175 RepID=A0A192H3B9_9LACO|nr:argininosuccinate lyase [Loigolactobacillus backii]ANK59968.1 argininosuccinate lyase [Loigolactobacillus backii]ANK63304.1 argininosuccinate lyase [Loigolactobacillus backii]ANK64902.1 argininosuccinate lyase [Loigolactobacillus backii]ANK66650.1 argininosuccinate lyase [Loigolactobacillus backii]ANK69691.1 argininosuccinate lyase [Loigolactobacillus backii]